jgi:hypothetical protein
MEPTISANDLSPGDRVVLRMQKSKYGPVPLAATFERFHDAESITAKLATPGNLILPGKWDEAIRSGCRLAAFRVGFFVGLFSVDGEGRLWDEEHREIRIVRREAHT